MSRHRHIEPTLLTIFSQTKIAKLIPVAGGAARFAGAPAARSGVASTIASQTADLKKLETAEKSAKRRIKEVSANVLIPGVYT